MIRVTFVDGATTTVANAAPGARLLDVAQAAGQPLEGTCDGAMACATCHVLINAADFAALPPASPDEEELLDLAAAATRYSRLSCQVRVVAPITVRVP